MGGDLSTALPTISGKEGWLKGREIGMGVIRLGFAFIPLDPGIGAPGYGFWWPCANTHDSCWTDFKVATLLYISDKSSSLEFSLDVCGVKIETDASGIGSRTDEG